MPEPQHPVVIDPKSVVSKNLREVGGKAYALSQLIVHEFPVPEFLILNKEPESANDIKNVLSWWHEIGSPPLAIRSSAQGEDSGQHSFAGQLSSFLNVSNESEIVEAIKKCFASKDREASVAYQKHFAKSAASMNVVIQRMVDPQFSGVFFSCDPRGQQAGWVLEAVEGLGEALVSGEVTPFRFSSVKSEDTHVPESWAMANIDKVKAIGRKAKKLLGYEVDMEWAIDKKGKLWVLQARPITTGDQDENDAYQINRELNRLQENYKSDTVWDGQTFAEFVGFPSYLTFSIWKQAFSPGGAFGQALEELGYRGFKNESANPKNTLLERIFGRAYINLSNLENLYFGEIPYTIKPDPRPHLKFSLKKLNLRTLVNFPKSLFRMIRVAWVLQTSRGELLKRCERSLLEFTGSIDMKPYDREHYADWRTEDLISSLEKQSKNFANDFLVWPFVLIIMIESSLQQLLSLMRRSVGIEEANRMIQKWMSAGLATVTAKMNEDFRMACESPSHRFSFLEKYGHRGPGEMDLKNPRWAELGDKAFYDTRGIGGKSGLHKYSLVDDEIKQNFSAIKQPLIKQEWDFLKQMLELREKWKMLYMRTYGNMRWLTLEIGHRFDLGEDVFWLRLSEVLKIADIQNKVEKINQRKPRFKSFRKLSFPIVISLRDLTKILNSEPTSQKDAVMEGEALSPGVSYGEVRIVDDPNTIDASTWPKDVILVAEATDPGWTPLFQRAKGVIVERGGVLSHCAIVAREMQLPAVSRILGCRARLKDGDHVWIDGTNGRVTIS